MLKVLVLLIGNLLVRSVPFKLPNFESVMASIMPVGAKKGKFAAGSLAFLSLFLFDLLHPIPGYPRIGIWTIVTATTYTAIGIAAGYFKPSSPFGYLKFSILATLIYDFITGLIMSSIIWKMPFLLALVGQVPFTLWHLAGNSLGALILSPLIQSWLFPNSTPTEQSEKCEA